MIKNKSKSIRARLLNLKKVSGNDYMYLLARYFNERLLYRVSVSDYHQNFLLKGGSLLYALDGLNARPTVDVDFMADKISRDRNRLEDVFRKILAIKCDEDGVTFNLAIPPSEPITVDKDYPGTRFFIIAHMDTIEYNMSVEVGFGDVVTPGPIVIDFPLLLNDVPAVSIQAYSIETVIAEKFHAMIDRDVANSRMKDFFDCHLLLTSNQKIDNDVLREAIFATFDNRKLHYNANLQLFTEAFVTDENRIKRWASFLKKIKWKDSLSFSEVMKVIHDRLQPIYNDYWDH